MGAELTVETVEALFAGTAKPTSQPDAGQIKNAPKIFKPDCAIDWTRSGEEIRNFVRGLSPYPAATTTMIDAKGSEISMKIYDVAYEKGSADKVGTIKTDRKKVLKIAAKDGFIDILSLQISGKKKITIDEFLRGYDVSTWKLATYNN